MNAVYYRDFGATGDGVTNDFAAIKRAHEYANENKLPVFAESGKTYYIGRTYGESIEIKTDTDWCGARFVIDDTCFEVCDSDREANVFVIAADSQVAEYRADAGCEVGDAIRRINENGGICGARKARLALGLGYPALVDIYNDDRRVFIRYGENEDSGSPQHELVLVDSDGCVSDTTPIYFDYEKLTRVRVMPLSEREISVGNAEFVTVANRAPRRYTYYLRSILVSRSYATLHDVDFKISGEGESGAPYRGSISVADGHKITVRDCILSAHKAYKLEGNDRNTMGSYGIAVKNANAPLFKNVTMHNFFAPGTDIPSVYAGYWGIMGSNYCKNITYDSCSLTRFDAHCGTYNATILDSEIAMLTLIGNGSFRIENSVVYTHAGGFVVSLRDDYGSTWNGDFLIKNVRAITSGNYDKTTLALMRAEFTNHNFGYKCYMPSCVTVDGFSVENDSVREITLVCGSATAEGISGDSVGGVKNINPYEITRRLVVKNNKAGYEYTKPAASDYSRVEIVKE